MQPFAPPPSTRAPRSALAAVIAACAAACLAAPAHAAAVNASFSFTLSGNTNVPTMTLVNTSDAGFRITGFSLTAGRTDRGWDYVQDLTAPAGGTATLLSPDAVNNGLRSYTIAIGFSDFGAGAQAGWEADLDGVSTNVTTNYRDSLFNNGAAPNATLNVAFEALVDGLTQAPFSIGFDLPDGSSSASSYTFSGQRSFTLDGPTPTVPEPGALSLAATGLLGLWLMRRRRG